MVAGQYGSFGDGLQAAPLRWSPDGHWLAFFDAVTGAITFRDQTQLAG